MTRAKQPLEVMIRTWLECMHQARTRSLIAADTNVPVSANINGLRDAAHILRGMLNISRWIPAREETVTFVDHAFARRETKLEIGLPEGGEVRRCLPIAIQAKESVWTWNVLERSAHEAVFVPKPEATDLTGRLLSLIALGAYNLDSGSSDKDELWRRMLPIVRQGPIKARVEAALMLDWLSGRTKGSCESAKALRAALAEALLLFADNRLVLLRLRESFRVGSVTVWADVPIDQIAPNYARHQLCVELGQALMTQHYSVRLEPPPDLTLNGACLCPRDEDAYVENLGGRSVFLRVDGVPTGSHPVLSTELSLEPGGSGERTFYIAHFLSVIIASGLLVHILFGLEPVTGSAIAIALTLPSLYSYFLFADKDHLLVRPFDRQFQGIATVCAFMSFLAGASLVVKTTSSWPLVNLQVFDVSIGGLAIGWRTELWALMLGFSLMLIARVASLTGKYSAVRAKLRGLPGYERGRDYVRKSLAHASLVLPEGVPEVPIPDPCQPMPIWSPDIHNALEDLGELRRVTN